MRADALLMDLGLANSRSEAKALLMAGKVRLGTEVIDKAGRLLPADAPLSVIQPPRFVSRGGEKLEGFLSSHPIPVSGLRALDIGASTGGFTDCLVQRGAP
ncbi:SAM-dependent methyltransferase, partial [Klebsiella pneumoniae]|uniref:SAM-dependent methyltransferase n=1 Tax=Klebsiella pneumoniae TaxID=573 RepID=UPI0021B0E051